MGLPWELLYTDDLCLIAETKGELVERLKCWRDALKLNGPRVNIGKTKVVCCKVRSGQAEGAVKWPCAMCKRGVGANLIKCTVYQRWVH